MPGIMGDVDQADQHAAAAFEYRGPAGPLVPVEIAEDGFGGRPATTIEPVSEAIDSQLRGCGPLTYRTKPVEYFVVWRSIGDEMNELLAVMGALSDRNRVRAVVACLDRELCVCQLIELLELAPSTVSKHLWILRQAGLLESRKDGRWIYYRIPSELTPVARDALRLLESAAADDHRAAEDRKRLKTILKCDPEKLCAKQRTESESCSSARGTPAGAKWRKAGLAGSKGT